MSCTTYSLKGLTLDCETNIGGIKEVYIANYADVDLTGVTLTGADATTELKASDINGAGKFHKYELRKQTGSMTSTLNVDEASGLRMVTTELVLEFGRMETKKRTEIAGLALGQLAVIVKDGNDKYWYLGADEYVSASGGSGQSGVNRTDKNAYSITLKEESAVFPLEIVDSIDSLIATKA